MKKYIMPTVKVAAINATAILAGSDKFDTTNDTEGYSEPGYEGGYAKNHGIWNSLDED